MKKCPILIFVFTILTVILTFFNIVTPVPEVAASGNQEFVNFVLTGMQGYYPYTYFDAQDLKQSTYTKDEVFYINREGETVNTYRALTDKVSSLFSAKHSSGKVDISLSGGMQKLVGTGRYFVYATAGLLSLKDDGDSKIVISLTAEGQTVSATSDRVYSEGTYEPEWVTTEKIYITNPNEIIRFNFQNREGSSIFDPAKFYIFEPTISFGYELDEIICNMQDDQVSEGQMIKLSAETPLSQIEQGGELLNYYKNYHKIHWEIVEGKNLAIISGNYLQITGNSGTVKIRAKCRKSSENDEFIYSDEITYNIIQGELKSLNIISNFPEGADILGGGVFDPYETGRAIFVSVKKGYQFFQLVDEDGENIPYNITSSDSYRAIIDLEETRTIKVILIKEVKMNEIVIDKKYYDKTDSAVVKEIIINGISEEHDVAIESTLTAKYSSILAGDNIFMNLSGGVDLVGEDAFMYDFDYTLPETYGEILKREITVTAHFAEKEYGYEDESLKYSISEGMLSGESLMGQISRVSGEAVGDYEIVLGSLNNPNYSINFISNIFRINKRNITVNQINIGNRRYDKTTNVYQDQVQFVTGTTFVDPQATQLRLNAEYEDVIGTNLLVNFSIEIIGENSDCYSITVVPTEIRANILPKQITVVADPQIKNYGEVDPIFTYNYDATELIEGDEISGHLTRGAGEDVGLYKIALGTLSLENYEINFVSANLIILKKNVTIYANQASKVYGGVDPELTFYTTDSDVEVQNIGLFLARSTGENVGSYEIFISSQINANYDILFVPADFIIQKRDLTIYVSVEEKQYDGKIDATISYDIINLVAGDTITLGLSAKFDDKNVGERIITYFYNGEEVISFDESLFLAEEIMNYQITFDEVSFESKIHKKDVVVYIPDDFVLEKQYGYDDTVIEYIAEGIVVGESLNGSLSRTVGENVGSYSINQGSLTNENNENYNVLFQNDKIFIINKRDVKLIVHDKEVVYGETEGEIEYVLSSETPLLSDMDLSQLIIGSATREPGFTAGVYQYLVGSLNISSSYRGNFNLIFVGGNFIINKRPIEIEVLNLEKTYGDSDPSVKYQIISGELVRAQELTFTRQPGENVGSYTLRPVLIDSYELTYTSGTLTIKPTEITVKANDILKIYGQDDPDLRVSIVDGILMFQDNFESVFTGRLTREFGESAGKYTISQGSFRASSNYLLTFEEGMLIIYKKDISVYADEIKIFADENTDPQLTYRAEGLVNGDELSGALSVEEIQGLGEYKISIGTLSSSDYNINFIGANLIVAKRKLNITINYSSKEYDGTSGADLSCLLSGDIYPGDEDMIQIELNREAGISVGRYLIDATVSQNGKYDVEIIKNYFEIFPRKINIRADNIEIIYGEQLPSSETWAYTVEGEIVDNDLDIKLYVVQNYCAGEFEILGTITNTNNYDVTFYPGTLKIYKKDIYISVENFSKTYGDSDPYFDYVVPEGSLCEGDILQGTIIRETGEKIGEYRLICSLFNENYNIIMTDAFLTITKKRLILVTSALDKVYDESDIAYLRMPMLSGIKDGDDIAFDYVITDLARFENEEIGDNKKVIIYGGQLIGLDAENYYLDYPTDLRANITNSVVENEFGNIFVYASENNTKLKKGTAISTLEMDTENITFGDSKSVIAGYNISLIYNENVLESYGSLSVAIDLGRQEYFNVQLYKVKNDGSMEIVKSSYRDGKIYFDTEDLGTYVIIADNDKWIDYTLIGLSTAILIMIGWIVFVNESKRHKRILAEKNKETGEN